MFADLVGSTATQEGMDPESVRRWLDRYYAVLRREIEAPRRPGREVHRRRRHGRVRRPGGPGGRRPARRGGRRACRARWPSSGAGARPGVGLRVGVNTGEVVVTADDDDVVGDVVNVAARLEQAARPGEVLVGEATFRLVRARAQLRAVPPLELKGKSEPVPAFLLAVARAHGGGRADLAVRRAGRRARAPHRRPRRRHRRPRGRSWPRSSARPASARRGWSGSWAPRPPTGPAWSMVRCDPAGGATFAPVAAALRQAASLDDDAARRDGASPASPRCSTRTSPIANRIAAGAAADPRRGRARAAGGDVLGGAPAGRERRRGAGRSSSCSTTSTGPSRCCSTSSRTSPSGPATCRCCSS